MQQDDFGERMKSYEAASTSLQADPNLPMIARLDGAGFSKLTKHLKKPFSVDFINAMQETAIGLADHFGAKIAYVQSDEITLMFRAKESFEYNGRFQKYHSLLAAKASVLFQRFLIQNDLYVLAQRGPIFDCRVWQVPNMMEAMNTFLWRQQDCMKNAISMVAQAHFHHKELNGKNGPQKIEMLKEKGIIFDEIWEAFRLGTLCFKIEVETDRLAFVPEQYRPVGPVRRKIWVQKYMKIQDLGEERVKFFEEL